VLKTELDSLRTLVGFITSTPEQVQEFEIRVISICPNVMDFPRPSIEYGTTRWDSNYDTIKSSLPYAKAFEDMALQKVNVNEIVINPENGEMRMESVKIPLISSEGWNNLGHIESLMETLMEATNVIRSQQTCTANLVINCVEAIRESMDKFDIAIAPVEAAESMAIKYQNYIAEQMQSHQFIIAHVLDPRWKLHFARMLDNMNNSTASSITTLEYQYRTIVRRCYNIYFKPPTSTHSTSLQSSNESILPTNEENSSLKSKSFFSNKIHAMMKEVAKKNEVICDELDEYLNDKLEDIEEIASFDVANWWLIHAGRFPNLERMARAILAVQASSIASESAFNTFGRVITDQKASYKMTEMIETRIMLGQYWLRAIREYRWKCNNYNF